LKPGQLVVETITHPAPISEGGAVVRYDRSSMFSMNVEPEEVDENLVLLYATLNGDTTSKSRSWRMVYRYWPTPASEASKAFRLEMMTR
jgi:hypothetical protein